MDRTRNDKTMNLIARGAEAELYETGEYILKKRIPKAYRHPSIDETLRKERTRKELGLLQRAKKAGVPCPGAEKIDESTLKLEKISGVKLATLGSTLSLQLAPILGEIIATLHNENIIHGDLTTSNIIHHEGTLSIIDFGLGSTSTRAEDRAVDLHVLEEALIARHPGNGKEFFEQTCNAYSSKAVHGIATLKRVAVVQSRGRNKKQF